jgi:hypothetical protein
VTLRNGVDLRLQVRPIRDSQGGRHHLRAGWGQHRRAALWKTPRFLVRTRHLRHRQGVRIGGLGETLVGGIRGAGCCHPPALTMVVFVTKYSSTVSCVRISKTSPYTSSPCPAREALADTLPVAAVLVHARPVRSAAKDPQTLTKSCCLLQYSSDNLLRWF